MHRTAHFHRSPSHRSPVVLTVPMFSLPVRSLWFLVLIGTLASELVPLSLTFEARFSPLTFYFYEAAKMVAFFVFGCLTPLAWWQSRSLGIGALFAIGTTAVVEFGQAFIPGHRTSVLELAVKLVLLFTGFIWGLDKRAYQTLAFGPLRVRFTSTHWSEHL
jgi:hypothetical protein